MDSYLYGVNGAIPSRYHTCADFATISEFLLKILNGNVTNFALSSFFQENSDYISNINFFPIDVSKFIDSSITQNNVVIGNKLASTTNSVKQIVQWKTYVELFRITISRKFNNFLDFAPYTRIRLYIPYFDFIEIPNEYAYLGQLNGFISVDFSSGRATLYIMRGLMLVCSKTTQLSISIPIGKTNAEELNRNKVLHTIQASVGGGMIAGSDNKSKASINWLGSVITNSLNDNLLRLTSIQGGDGNTTILATDKTPRIIYEYPQNVFYPDAHAFGKPLQQSKPLNVLTGFTKIDDIHFDPMNEVIYQDEINEIVTLLKDGVIF